MPIYAYRCQSCSHLFEVLHRTSTIAPPEACPECGAAQPQRVLSAVASVVKDSGNSCQMPGGMCGMDGGGCGAGPCGMGGCGF